MENQFENVIGSFVKVCLVKSISTDNVYSFFCLFAQAELQELDSQILLTQGQGSGHSLHHHQYASNQQLHHHHQSSHYHQHGNQHHHHHHHSPSGTLTSPPPPLAAANAPNSHHPFNYTGVTPGSIGDLSYHTPVGSQPPSLGSSNGCGEFSFIVVYFLLE